MKKKNPWIYVLAVFISLAMIFPFIWGFILSFKNNTEIFGTPMSLPQKVDLGLYVTTFKSAHLLLLFKNSLLVSVITLMVSMVIIFISSFSIARLNQRYKGMSNFFYYLFLAATSVPVFILLMPIYNIGLGLGKISGILGIDSLFGLILPYIACQIPFSTLMFVGGMRGIPMEMEEAGLIDGCRLLSLIFRIDLPLLVPVVITLFIFQFLGIWNEFPIASILLNSTKNFTIPLAMSFFKDQYSTDYGAIMRGIIMILIPQLIFYFIFQKRIIEGMATAGIKG